MSLYLTILDGEEELEGWTLGHYSDFGYFREVIESKLGAKDYPVLMQHSDCDGEWPANSLHVLKAELDGIASAFEELPAEEIASAFEHTAEYRSAATNLYECFHNVDGENLFDALRELCELGAKRGLPILFQ